MALQYSVAVRNARLDAIETNIGTNAIMEIFDGVMPANCAAPDVGTKLVQIPLGSDWMSAASGGTKAKNGTWQGTAIGTGNAYYFRIYDSESPNNCEVQGTVGPAGSPTFDMTIDNTSISVSQTVTVSTFTITAGNA